MPTKEAISRLMDHMQGENADEFEALTMAALDETQGDLDAAIDMARMVMQREAKLSTDEGKWITLGGRAEGEEKHKGGFKVFVGKDGVIKKGRLQGKKVSEVKTAFDEKRKGKEEPKEDKPFAKAEEKEEKPFAKPEAQGAGEQPAPQPEAKEAPRVTVQADQGAKAKLPDDATTAALASAPEGAKVHAVSGKPFQMATGEKLPPGVTLTTSGKGFDATRHLYTAPDGKKVMYNESIEIRSNSPYKGQSASLLAKQVAALRQSGVDRLEAIATGPDYGDYNGHYTLPRLGFDGPIPESVLKKIPSALKPAKPTVLSLMATPEGRDWWKKNGRTFKASFDLRKGSDSEKALDAYLSEKGQLSPAPQPEATKEKPFAPPPSAADHAADVKKEFGGMPMSKIAAHMKEKGIEIPKMDKRAMMEAIAKHRGGA